MLKKLVGLILALSTLYSADAQRPFITVWETSGSTIRIDATGSFTYSWTDLNTPSHTGSGNGLGVTQVSFGTAGKYRLEISPAGTTPFSRFEMNYGYPHYMELTEISQWGDIAWSSMEHAFMGAQRIKVTATDIPDLSGVTNMGRMFSDCMILPAIPNIGGWNVSQVTNMSGLFAGCFQLNGIAGIAGWDVSKVKDMSAMFASNHLFNENISNWNVASVTDMSNTFADAQRFNQDISNWDVSSVIDMNNMFFVATAFNQPIGNWAAKTHNVQNTMAMFSGATAFNQEIGQWDMSSVTDMQQMFWGATSFNKAIGSWDVSKVKYMSYMFANATAFNQDISGWNVGEVQDMESMFANASAFNTNIGQWDVRKVAKTAYMLYQATAFNQNLGNWKLNALTVSIFGSSAEGMLSFSGMDCNNYSRTLIGWAGNPDLLMNVKLGADGLKYGTAAVNAREKLRTVNRWSITDAGTGTCLVTLPVYFGDVHATFKNGQLMVTWTTLMETGNSHFEMEASVDGKVFNKIGIVNSLSAAGNSSVVLHYSFNKDAKGVGLLGMSMLIVVLGCSFFGRKNGTLAAIAISITLMVNFSACSKQHNNMEFSGSKIFIRIKQVDKDDKFEYSKVVLVVRS